MLKYFVLFFIFTKVAFAKYENYASLSVNLKSGEVLYSKNPDKTVVPASLTKLMTIYLAFEALNEGRIGLYDKIQISENSTKQLEKKIHLKRNKKYTFKELLMSAAIFSANDSAVAIAEEISGSVEDFVYLMNQKAAELGMVGTKYGNPTGMPNAINYTTPKDIITLAKRLSEDFPQYYYIFGTELFAQNSKIYGNSNRLLPFFKGMNGLKTGFTNAAGYNLVSSFKYKDDVIIAVVFGLSTAKERDNHMKEIMDYSVKKTLNRKVSDKAGISFEYEAFLKDHMVQDAPTSLYFELLQNILKINQQDATKITIENKSLSVIDKALSEIGNFGDLMSHPLPILHDE